MIDFTEHVRVESDRFAAVIRAAVETGSVSSVMESSVPTCPDWSVADLVWHLAEVQDFWAYILSQQGVGPETYDRPERPGSAELLGFLESRSRKLVAALDRSDDEPCWSWSRTGGTVGWVRRRQAQEALIHRVDAERAVGQVTPLDDELASDGVDEMLRVMLDIGDLPPWAAFDAEENHIVIDTGKRWWSVRLGRFSGTDPENGETADLAALSVVAEGLGNGLGAVGDGDTHIRGSAVDLNLWLWGRGESTPFDVTGDENAAVRLRATTGAIT